MKADLTTSYLGMDLSHPIVASSSPLTGTLTGLQRLEEAGAAAVVLPSLFEEQLEHEAMEVNRVMELGSESFAEAIGYFPELEDYNTGPASYLASITEAKEALSIPVIASLNGMNPGGWARYGKQIEESGADALELNVYFVADDPDASGQQVEERYLDLVRLVRDSISIPMAVKLGPFFSSMAHMARQVVAAGADGLVLFNRFYQPDIDLKALEVSPHLVLSTSDEMRLVLRWMAILRGRVDTSLAATTGVHTADDVIKLLLAGADVAMMASALLENGPEHVRTVVEGVGAWLDANGYVSASQARGSLSQQHAPDPSAFERANYMKTLVTYAGDGV